MKGIIIGLACILVGIIFYFIMRRLDREISSHSMTVHGGRQPGGESGESDVRVIYVDEKDER